MMCTCWILLHTFISVLESFFIVFFKNKKREKKNHFYLIRFHSPQQQLKQHYTPTTARTTATATTAILNFSIGIGIVNLYLFFHTSYFFTFDT